MVSIHLVLRRINPALKIDLAQVGRIEDGHFVELPVSALEDTSLFGFLRRDSISDCLYVFHSDVSTLVGELSLFSGFSVDFFDNTLVLMFNCDIRDESASKEEESGN